jgi:DNA-binding transcriptional ArsR family regulator
MDKYDNWKNIALFNTQTGEILEGGIPIYVGAKVKWRENWFMGIQEAFIALAKDKEIAGRARRILDYLFGKLGFENYICVTQQEISKELDIEKENVSREIKKLVNKGIILPGPKLGRTSTYRLNSEYGWRGKVRNLADARMKPNLELVKK